MFTKHLCSRKVRGFAVAFRARKAVSGAFEKRALGARGSKCHQRENKGSLHLLSKPNLANGLSCKINKVIANFIFSCQKTSFCKFIPYQHIRKTTAIGNSQPYYQAIELHLTQPFFFCSFQSTQVANNLSCIISTNIVQLFFPKTSY